MQYMQVPSQVEYERATSVEHALSLLSRPDTRVVAGGHSIVPMMKLRLAQPEVLVDINELTELAFIKLAGGQLRIGALARHADLLDSAVAGELFPIFHDAERVVADRELNSSRNGIDTFDKHSRIESTLLATKDCPVGMDQIPAVRRKRRRVCKYDVAGSPIHLY